MEPGANHLLRPGLFIRLAAITYDCILLFALLFFATAIILPFNNGEAFDSKHTSYPVYLLYLLLVSFLFFAGFWTHGGQTLGMKSWKIIVITDDGKALNWQQAGFRFIWALFSILPCGLGFLWALGNKERKTWHDTLSKTHLVKIQSNKPNTTS